MRGRGDEGEGERRAMKRAMKATGRTNCGAKEVFFPRLDPLACPRGIVCNTPINYEHHAPRRPHLQHGRPTAPLGPPPLRPSLARRERRPSPNLIDGKSRPLFW